MKLRNTTYWSRKLFLFTESARSGRNSVNQRRCLTLETWQKNVKFHHYKGIDVLKLGCNLPNPTKLCLHCSTCAIFYPFTDNAKALQTKDREDKIGRPSLVFTRKVFVDETHIHKSINVCKSTIGIDASQTYPCSLCQAMPTRQHTKYEFDADLQRLKPRQTKFRRFENMVLLYFQRMLPDCRNKNFYTTGTQKNTDCFNADGFCGFFSTVFEARGLFLLILILSGSMTCAN